MKGLPGSKRQGGRYPFLAVIAVGAFFALGAEYVSCIPNAPDPAEVGDANPCGPDGVCAITSADKRRCKYNLDNHWWYGWKYLDDSLRWKQYKIAEGHVLSDWCFNKSNSRIRSRSSTPASWSDFPVNAVRFPVDYWHTSHCNGYLSNGTYPTDCLTRRETQMSFGVTIAGVPLQGTIWRCIGTRIHGSGGHSRNIIEGRCPDGALLQAQRARATRRRADAVVGVNDLASPAAVRRIRRACTRSRAITFVRGHVTVRGDCKTAIWDAYRSLSPAERREVRG